MLYIAGHKKHFHKDLPTQRHDSTCPKGELTSHEIGGCTYSCHYFDSWRAKSPKL